MKIQTSFDKLIEFDSLTQPLSFSYMVNKNQISDQCLYALHDYKSKMILAVDTKPHFLNLLRLGLPDCYIKIYPRNIQIEYDTNLVHFKLAVLKKVNFFIERILADYKAWPPFMDDEVEVLAAEHLVAFADHCQINLTHVAKRFHFFKENYREIKGRSLLMFYDCLNKVNAANSEDQLKVIESSVVAKIHEELNK